MLLLAIDPGAKGAIASWDSNSHLYSDEVSVEPMPETLADLWIFIKEFMFYEGYKRADVYALVERVGTYMPGNSGPAAVKFARHVGNIEAILTAAEIPYDWVLPRKWQQSVLGSVVPKEKPDRKRAIKAAMQRLYPKLHVTLANADALGILTYELCRRNIG